VRLNCPRDFPPKQTHYRLDVASFSFRTPSFFLAQLGAIPSLLYIFYSGPSKSVLLTNILALSFACDAMSMLKIDSFRTGSILLSGLFLYDVWWVFGTKVVCNVPRFFC
jgi:minor histocompatibility antigen H13